MKINTQEILKEHGLKDTPVRSTLLSIFWQSRTPLDVEGLSKILSFMKVKTDVTTIYRTLQIFLEKGILKQIELQEGKFRYERASLPHHHHLVCKKCGDISGVGGCTVEEISKDIAQKNEFKITDHKMEFFGFCAKCH